MRFEAEYEALRNGVGGRLVVRDGVVVRGPDSASFLQGQCTQDVEVLGVGDSADALLLEPQGKLDCYVRVTRTDEDEFTMDTDAGFGEGAAARLLRFKLRVKADIEETALHCAQLRGPASGDVASDGLRTVSFSWGPATGVDMFDASSLPAGVVECGPEAWEALRVEAGIPVMGAELDERTIAAEAGLLERTVSFTKGCYTGQELVARLDSRGNKVARHLRGLVAGASAGAALSVGWTLEHQGKSVGSVTSAADSPAMGRIALGYVHRAVEPGAVVDAVGPEGTRVPVEVRLLPLRP